MTVDKEAILRGVINDKCTCHEIYTSRKKKDPDCEYHRYWDDLIEAMDEYAASLNKNIHDKLQQSLNQNAKDTLENASLLKENEELKKYNKLQAEFWEYWKARCEAAEAAYNSAKDWWEKELSLEGYEKLSDDYDKWQELKQKLPQRVIEGL